MTSNLTLAADTYLGQERLHRKITVQSDGEETRDILWWNGAEHRLPDGKFDMAFTVGWNTYQGRRDMAITLQAIREYEPSPELPAGPRITLKDWRHKPAPGLRSAFLQQEPDGIIWMEGVHNSDLGGVLRDELSRTDALLIYTTPPSSAVLHAALELAQPARLYIGAVTPPDQTQQVFLKRLLGLCKYTIRKKDGLADPVRLAAATAQSISAVLWGLRFLATKHVISLHETEETIRIGPPTGDTLVAYDEHEAANALRAALAETTAYRKFFARSSVEALVI